MEEENLPNPAADSFRFLPDDFDGEVVAPLPSSLLRTRASFVMVYSRSLSGSPFGLPLEIVHPLDSLPFAEDGQDLRGAFQQVSVQNDQIGPRSHVDTSRSFSPMIRAGVRVRALTASSGEAVSHCPSGEPENRRRWRKSKRRRRRISDFSRDREDGNHVVALFPLTVALVERRESPGVRRDGSPGGFSPRRPPGEFQGWQTPGRS